MKGKQAVSGSKLIDSDSFKEANSISLWLTYNSNSMHKTTPPIEKVIQEGGHYSSSQQEIYNTAWLPF